MEKFEPHAEITWLGDVSAVRVKWNKLFMSLERFQEICVAAFGVLRENNGAIWIADQHDSEGVFSKEIQDFILNELSEIAQANKLEMVLTILPKNSGLSTMSVKRWTSGVRDKNEFISEQFENLEDCKEWIHHVHTTAT